MTDKNIGAQRKPSITWLIFRETQKLVRGHLRAHQALFGLYFIVFLQEKTLPSNQSVEKVLQDLSVMGMAVALQRSEVGNWMMSGKMLSFLPTVHLTSATN